MTFASGPRAKITVNAIGEIQHNGKRCGVVLTRDMLQIACADVEPAVMHKLMREYKKHFPETEALERHVLQEPPPPDFT